MARRTRKRKSGAAGIFALEAIAIIGFAAWMTTAQTARDAATANSTRPEAGQAAEFSNLQDDNWEGFRPRFSQAVSELWSNGF